MARIVYARSDFPHPFQFSFSKEGPDQFVQNRPGSDLDGLVRVWPNTSGLEASWCAGIIGTGFWQDVTGPLLVSHFQTRFRSSTDIPDNILQNQPESDLVLADCVRFWPNGSGPEASRCTRNIRPASGQCFPADPDRMRIGSGMFTGLQGLCFRPGRPKSPIIGTSPGRILHFGIVHHVELLIYALIHEYKCFKM